MRTAWKVFRYEVRNVLRGKALLGYAAFFVLVTTGLVALGGGVQRALPSLVSVVLLVVPLASLLLTVVALYDGRDFTELLLAHPVARGPLLLGRYLGLTLPLALALPLGVGAPLGFSGIPGDQLPAALLILGAGVLLTAVFTALGLCVTVLVQEPARGLGLALVLWLALTLLYDGAVLAAAHAFSAWPLEEPMLVAMLLNPVDLARMVMLVAVDASVLAGYTGAVFADFFGGVRGPLLAAAALLLWVGLPGAFALRRFRRMDL